MLFKLALCVDRKRKKSSYLSKMTIKPLIGPRKLKILQISSKATWNSQQELMSASILVMYIISVTLSRVSVKDWAFQIDPNVYGTWMKAAASLKELDFK